MPSAWKDEDAEEDHDKGTTPDKVERHRTDCLCCVLFVLALVFQALVFHYAVRNGNPGKFAHLPTASGDFCGMTEAVKDKPYLYFCMDGVGSLSYKAAKCVADCSAPACQGRQGYSAKEFFGMVCIPDKKASKKLAKEVMTLAMGDPNVEGMMSAKSIVSAWEVLAGTTAASVIFAFLYLRFLDKFAGCLIWIAFAITVLGSGALGAAFLWASQQPPYGLAGMPSSGNAQKDLYVGTFFVSLSLLSLCVLICKRKTVNQAIHSISSAAECIAESPGLLFEPMLAALVKLIAMVVLISGFLYLLTVGDGVSYHPEKGIEVHYSNAQYAYIAFYAVFSFWFLELCSAMSSFVIAYVTQLWFFKEFSLLGFAGLPKAYIAALWYHLGSLAFGSLVIALTRVVRIALQIITQGANDSGNPVAAAVGCVMACLVACFERFLQMLNRFAYMDVAINSNSFCTAARHALTVLTHDATTVITMEGATFIFEVAGAAAVTAFGGGVAYLVVTKIDTYSDPSKDTYVDDPATLSMVAAAISFLVSLPFMSVFGCVSDTILFCFALERSRTPMEEEKKSFMSHMSCVCWSKSPTLQKRPVADISRHPTRTQALLDHCSHGSAVAPDPKASGK